MQFLIVARDHADGLSRRLESRQEHLEIGKAARESGERIIGGPLLDEYGEMNGSVIIADFPSREELDAWLKAEPYVTNDVWNEIEIIPCKVKG